ncbi:hypothetical protein EYV94_15185 [Puteibacter caeruleilacunae]|nr:hypothetical protein EYV94_15185 [Puteibacter caeruleilacunae]
MKYFLIFLISTATLASCSLSYYNRVQSYNDSVKNIDQVRLTQSLRARSDEYKKAGNLYTNFLVTTTFLHNDYLETDKEETTLNLEMNLHISYESMDSTLYVVINDIETHKLYPVKTMKKDYILESTTSSETKSEDKTTTSTTTSQSTRQFMKYKYILPEEIIYKLEHSNKFTFKIYLGDTGYNLMPTQRQIDVIKKFCRTF